MANIPSSSNFTSAVDEQNSAHKTSSLIVLISVFFFWGFVAASNDILIPVFKEKLNLLCYTWQTDISAGRKQTMRFLFF